MKCCLGNLENFLSLNRFTVFMYPTWSVAIWKPWQIRRNFLKESCSTHIALQFLLVDFLLTWTGLGDIEVQSWLVRRPNWHLADFKTSHRGWPAPGLASRVVPHACRVPVSPCQEGEWAERDLTHAHSRPHSLPPLLTPPEQAVAPRHHRRTLTGRACHHCSTTTQSISHIVPPLPTPPPRAASATIWA